MEKKKCSKCLNYKSVSDFNKRGKGLQPFCRSCQNEWTKKDYLTNKQYYLDKAKKSQQKVKDLILKGKDFPCVDCGIKYPPYVMDFDHLGKKDFNLSGAHYLKGKNAVLEEIAKCEIVCSNCHRERTHKRLLADSVIGNTLDSELRD